MLPYKVTARYVTAVFIDAEDYIDLEQGNGMHPGDNVEVQAIILNGKKVRVPPDLLA